MLQEKEKAAAAELKVKQRLLELHRKNEEQVRLRNGRHDAAECDFRRRMFSSSTILASYDELKLFKKKFR